MEARIRFLRESLIKELSPYYIENDKGHQEGHFDEVFLTGQLIRDKLGLPYRDELMMVTSYVHDIFSSFNRENHHNLSGDFVRDKASDLITMVLTDEELWLCEFACREHRASYKGSFTSRFSELFNSADLEGPKGYRDVFNRAVMFRLNKGETCTQTILEETIKHMDEKFSSTGYVRYPKMYMDVFGDEVRKQTEDLDRLIAQHRLGQVTLDFPRCVNYPYLKVGAC